MLKIISNFVTKNFLIFIVFFFFCFSVFYLFSSIKNNNNDISFRVIRGKDTFLDLANIDFYLTKIASTSQDKVDTWQSLINSNSTNIDIKVFAQDKIYEYTRNNSPQKIDGKFINEMAYFYAENSVNRSLTDNTRSLFILRLAKIIIFKSDYYDQIITELNKINPYGGIISSFKTRGELITGLDQFAYDTYRSADNFDFLMFRLLKSYEFSNKISNNESKIFNIKSLLGNKQINSDLKEKYNNTPKLSPNDLYLSYHFLNLISFTENKIKDDSQEIELLMPVISKFDTQIVENSAQKYMFQYCLAKYYLYKKDNKNAKIFIEKMNNFGQNDSEIYLYFKYYSILDSDKQRFQKIVSEFMR